MKTRNVWLPAGLLLATVCGRSWGTEWWFYRVGRPEGAAPANLAIVSDELGEIFLEFDTDDQRTYVIEGTGRLTPSPSWRAISSLTGDGQRASLPTTRNWSRTFGGSEWDAAYSAAQTFDGAYIIAGCTYSFGPGSGDAYLIKTDQDGREVWSRTFGGSDDDRAESVQQSSDGGYILAGWTRSFGPRRRNAYLIKTDQNGNEVWSSTFGGDGRDWAMSVQQTSDGGYILAGYTESFGAGSYDVYLIKTDQNGNEVWSRTFGGTDDDRARCVQQTSDGGYIIGGCTGCRGYGPDGGDVYLVKTDENGRKQWSRSFGGEHHDSAYCVDQTSDGGYIVGGYTWSFGAGLQDAYLIKADPMGNEVWSRAFGGHSSDWVNSVQQTSDGGYILAGATATFGAGGDVYLIRTDCRGGEIWSGPLGGTEWDEAYSVRQTSDGGYFLAGQTESFGAGKEDVYLIKTDRDGNAPLPE